MDKEYESFLTEIGGGSDFDFLTDNKSAKKSTDDEYANFMASIGESAYPRFFSRPPSPKLDLNLHVL